MEKEKNEYGLWSVRRLVKDLKEKKVLRKLLKDIDESEVLRRFYFFKDGTTIIVPITRKVGLLLKPYEKAEEYREFCLRAKGIIKHIRDFYVNRVYEDYTVTIMGKKYVIEGVANIDFRRGRLYGFLGVFATSIQRIENLYHLKESEIHCTLW